MRRQLFLDGSTCCSFCTPGFEEPDKLFFFMENQPGIYPVKVPKKMLFDKCPAPNLFEPTRCQTKNTTLKLKQIKPILCKKRKGTKKSKIH